MIRKDFGNDLCEAVRIHALAVQGGRSGVTLRCKNMGFPPPAKYRPDPEEPNDPAPLELLNEQGVWWCPYCMKLRKFKKVSGYRLDGIWVAIPGMVCPMCKTSHRDPHVQRWNPLARQITDRGNDPNPRRARKVRREARERKRR